VLITAKADTVKSRMEARGRDTADEIMQRLQRSAEMDKSMPTTLVIENDGSLQQAVKKLENYMNRLLSENPLS
jgi:ribose 1,5-bisphosphokinase